jgi:hypothetical protein
MDSPNRAKWLAAVLASFPPRPRKRPQPREAGDSVRVGVSMPEAMYEKGAAVEIAAPAAEGIAVESDGEARAWLEEVLKERPCDTELPLPLQRDARQEPQ